MEKQNNIVLEINDLLVKANTIKGEAELLRIDHLQVNKGEILGIVGESGSGKSILALTILDLLPSNVRIVSGEIRFNGEDISKLSHKQMRSKYLGKQLTMIFQDPMASLSPVFTVRQQLEGVIRANSSGLDKKQVHSKAVEMLSLVKLSDPEMTMEKYPHELSGGMRQRVLIAMALSAGANFLISDEATRALDVTIQAGVLKLMEELAATLGLSVLFISSNIALAAAVCSNLGILYSGEIVESGSAKDILQNPQHCYTKAFLSCLPTPEKKGMVMTAVPGRMPDPLMKPEGCKFHPRCSQCEQICRETRPILHTIGNSHAVACHIVAPLDGEKLRTGE